MICVCLAEKTPDAVLKGLHESASKADIAEIRLDALLEPASVDLKGLIEKSPCPLIITNRCEKEGGCFHGTEEKRFAILEKAVEAGPDYVDIELASPKSLRTRLIEKARRREVQVILSFHDLHGTPPAPQLERILEAEKKAGADVGKIVTFAHSSADVRTVLSLYFYKSEGRMPPLIAFCMGDKGRISRLACLALGAHLSFAAPAGGRETAPGQIPLDLFRWMHDYLHGHETKNTGPI